MHVSFCACRQRVEIVNRRIPDSLVMCNECSGLENGIRREEAVPWMDRQRC